MVIGLTALFIGWLLYRLLVKRDLREHKDTLAVVGLFIGAWALLAYWLWG